MTEHAAGALGFLETGADLEADDTQGWVPSFPALREQETVLSDKLMAGFETRERAFLWSHAVAAVTIGQIGPAWHRRILDDRWMLACLLTPNARDGLTPHAPSESVAKSERMNLRREIIEAFNAAMGVLREQSNELDEEPARQDPDRRQKYIAVRPRLQQLVTAQHRAVAEVLGVDDHDRPIAREAAIEWGKTVAYASAGFLPDGFVRRLDHASGRWRTAITLGGPVLEEQVAKQLLPAFTLAVWDATQRGSETLGDVSITPDQEVPSL